MKKLKMAPVVAVILAVIGYLLQNYTGTVHIQKDNYKTTAIPHEIVEVREEGLKSNRYINAVVVKVTDGDTIDVKYKNRTYKVRMLDVDTPESVKRGVSEQPYGKEASEFTRKMVFNKPVKLVFEKRLTDKYERLLAHVILQNGEYLNALLVRNGYARVEIVAPNSMLSNYFSKLQEEAIRDKTGVWGLPQDKCPFVKNDNGEYVPRYWLNRDAS